MPSRTPLFVVAALAVAALVCWRFPLFRIISLRQAEQAQKVGTFDAAKVAENFWHTKLMPATERAVELKILLAALAKDPDAARKQHGRTLGIGGATMFLARGSGKITSVSEDSLVLSLHDSGASVTLNLGLLFGNTVRDASGLLDVSAYPDSQEFNALSTQLNAFVESKVAPALKQAAAVGKSLRFAGCFELDGEAKLDALIIIPLKVEWP